MMRLNKKLLILTCLMGLLVWIAGSGYPGLEAAPKSDARDDGLTVIKLEAPKDSKPAYCFMTLILKTGYAGDPAGRKGLTRLTNQLLYLVLYNSSAIDVQYDTYAGFSQFNFIVSAKNFKTFCDELDTVIRKDALLMYDECRGIIQDYKNEPRLPGDIGLVNLYKLLYGNDHPYLAVFNADFTALDIDLANDWFRKVYRPNNLIIATSADLPSDFLMKPSGRDMKEPVAFPKIPPAGYAPKPVLNCAQIEGNISSIYIGLPAPALNEDSVFGAIMLERYLQRELWNKLREEMGLCYDIQVSYDYLREPDAPSLVISMETLPADADNAVAKVVEVLRGITAKGGVPAAQLTLIKDQEKNRIAIKKGSTFYKLNGLAYDKLYKAAWLKDPDEYLKRFNKITADDLAKLVAARLKYIKIAVARPNSDVGFEKTGEEIGKLDDKGGK